MGGGSPELSGPPRSAILVRASPGIQLDMHGVSQGPPSRESLQDVEGMWDLAVSRQLGNCMQACSLTSTTRTGLAFLFGCQAVDQCALRPANKVDLS
jgi:hypothetical protein